MKKVLSLFLCLTVLVSCLCFTQVSAGDYLSTDKTEYAVGDAIMVTATGSGTDWVGIYPASDPTDGSKTSIYWYYVATYGSGNAVNIKTTELNADRGAWASIPAGDYKIVWYSNDSYNVYDTVNITVVEADTTNTTYDFTINGQEVADGDLLTFTKGDTVTLEPTAKGGSAGEAWVAVYYAYYTKNTPFQNAGGNMEDWAYVGDHNGSSWDITGTLWSGRSTIVLFGDGGYTNIVKIIQIQYNGFGEIDFTFNGKEVENNTTIDVYKGLESAVLNMSAGGEGLNGHGNAWFSVYAGQAGNSTADYSGLGYGDWAYVSNGDHNITSKLQEGRNTVVVFGNEKYNDIRKCIVVNYVTPDFSVDVETLDSAAIRLDKTGLRFYTDVDADKIAELMAHGATVEAGTLIGPADLNAEALTLETDAANIVDVKFDLNNKDGYYTEGEFTGIVGSLVSIRDKNISRDFLARGYVKVTYNGETYVSYSEGMATRSLRTVAQAIKANAEYYDSIDANFQANIDTWAAAADFVA